MNPGLLPGFGRSRQGARRIVGHLANPASIGAGGYAESVLKTFGRCVTVQSGSTTAGVATEYLNVRGGGRILMMGVYGNNGTPRDVTTVLKVDGSEIVNDTATALTTSGKVYVGTGAYAAGLGPLLAYQSIEFSDSLELVASGSLTETNGFTMAYNIELWE